jgi:hypothetical protein
MKQLVAAGLALACLLTLGGPTRADLITFDDISTPGLNAPIPNGYHGLDWINFHVRNTTLFLPSGFVNGTVSAPNVAYSGGGLPAIIHSSTRFDLDSGYFTAAWNNGLHILATGWRHGHLLDFTTFTVNTSGPKFEDLDFHNVDTVVFFSWGGTHGPFDGRGTEFVLDNLTVDGRLGTQNLPEPTSLALLGIGVAAMSLYGWWRGKVN